ncbi:MAG: mycofactocin system FadH/OYE family oxidoreductase 2, partial [Chloroflexi bacterium]|nr:mycofactocin system FadH/OYE family oxidoreductase 2 [Chloroflexota bacterium]
GSAAVGERVIVVDGGENFWPQCSTAEALAARGKRVELLSPGMWVGAEINSGFIPLLYRRFREGGIRLTPQVRLAAVEDGAVVVADVFTGERRRIDGVDTVVLAMGSVADDGLYHALKGRVAELHAVGDCVAPRRLDAAVREGFLAGQAI